VYIVWLVELDCIVFLLTLLIASVGSPRQPQNSQCAPVHTADFSGVHLFSYRQ